MSIERITRSAPQHCFNGGQTGHGPIEPAYNPRKDLGWGMVCIVAFLGIVLAFAAMTPGA